VISTLLRLDKQLAGAPDTLLTVGLLLVALLAVLAALGAKPLGKAALLTWFVLP
jgi:hypothetical protein